MSLARGFLIFGPEAPYERGGDVNDVMFPCGQVVGEDGDTISLYYGAADSWHSRCHGKYSQVALVAEAELHTEKLIVFSVFDLNLMCW